KALDTDFLLTVGDLVDKGQRYEDWRLHLYGPAQDLLRHTPWLPVWGNHDFSAANSPNMTPGPDSAALGWYLHRIGKLAILAINSNVETRPNSPQGQWLAKTLTSKPWTSAGIRIAAFHHPPFTNYWNGSLYAGEPSIRSSLVP